MHLALVANEITHAPRRARGDGGVGARLLGRGGQQITLLADRLDEVIDFHRATMTRRLVLSLDRFPPKDASTEVGRWKSTRIPNGVPSWVDLGTSDLPKARCLLRRPVRLEHPGGSTRSRRLLDRRAARQAGRRARPAAEPRSAVLDRVHQRRQRRRHRDGDQPQRRPGVHAAVRRHGRRSHGDRGRSDRCGVRTVGAEATQGCRHRQRAEHVLVGGARHRRRRGGQVRSTRRCSVGRPRPTAKAPARTPRPSSAIDRWPASWRGPRRYPAEAPNSWGVYFTVTDTDKAVARISELGGSTFVPPMDIEPGRFAVVTDPAGAFFHVITMKEPRGRSSA